MPGETFQSLFGDLFPHVGDSTPQGVAKTRETDNASGNSLQATLVEKEAILDRLNQSPLFHAAVVAIGQTKGLKRVVIAVDGRKFEVGYPSEITLEPGDTVRISKDTLQILGLAHVAHQVSGVVAKFMRTVDDTTCEVSIEGQMVVVSKGKLKGEKVGTRVVVDTSKTVILAMLSEIDLGLTSKPQAPVEWDDVGGLEQAKRELRDAIDSPTRYPELYRHYNKKPPRGILLYGPPGTGKTYLVKAAATAHARANNLPLGISGMLYVKASELVTKYVGVSEENLREVFRTAREFYETYKCPLLVFFDEAEATFKKRGSGISSDVQDTMVPTLLTEMDGFDENHVLAIFATNRVDILDPALLRDGRIDVKLYIGRPDIKVAETILGIHLKRVPVLEEFENSAAFAAAEFFNPKYAYNLIVVSSKVDPAQVEEIPFTLGNLASGASLAGIVERARNNAFHRDVNNKTMTGVGQEDILAAIRTTFESNERLNLAAEIELFVEQIDDIKQRFRGLKPLRQVTA